MNRGMQIARQLVLPIIITTVALIGGVFNPSAAAAATYFVATNGNDANPGTQGAPFRSIKKGTSVLRAGDTLRIRGGTYREHVSLDNAPRGSSWSNSVTVEAQPNENVIWEVPSGERSVLNILDVSYLIFRGIIFDGKNGTNNLVRDGYTTTPVSGAERFINFNCASSDPSRCAHHIRFEGNEFRYAAYGIAHASHLASALEFVKNSGHHLGKVQNCNVFYMGSPNSLFDGNSFTDIGCTVIGFWNQSGPTVHNGIIRNNRIVRAGWFWSSEGTHENNSTPIQANTVNLRGPALFVSRGSGAKVYNNIIVDSPGGIYAGHDVRDCLISNNTIYGNTASGIGEAVFNSGISLSNLGGGATNCTVRNNIVYQPGVTSPPPITDLGVNNSLSNNLTSDPRFVNAAGHDFHLQSGSPAIDKGVTLTLLTQDIDGVTRPQGGAYDIGAYEYQLALARLAPPAKFRMVP